MSVVLPNKPNPNTRNSALATAKLRLASSRKSITAQVIVEQAQERGETLRGVDSKAVATLIVASLEGALMMSRIQRNDEPLRRVQSHLNGYLDREVAVSR